MRYQYTSDGFQKDFYGKNKFFKYTAVNSLILINLFISFFPSQFGFDRTTINHIFGLNSDNFQIWQLFTYMFLHAGLMHLFFNMFLLWMFGKQIESIWGAKKFISYYLIAGLGSGFFIWLLSNSITIGASGAVMAILFAYGYLYPNRTLLFYLIPMKAKYCILILIITELLQELLRNPSDNVSHVGHLGGMFVGYLYLKFGKQIFYKVPFIRIKRVKTKTQNEEISTGNIDIILDKLKLEGWDGLTEDEKSKLYQASKEKEEHHSIN
jgi:membrane associated rhomboid family serine protease